MKRYLALTTLALALTCELPAKTTKDKADFEVAYRSLPAYKATLEGLSVDEESLGLRVHLSDGSSWQLIGAADLTAVAKSWNAGDDIRIEEYEDGVFVLKSSTNPAYFLAELDLGSYSLYYIDKIDANGYLIVANDGSEWVQGWLGAVTSQYWNPGDFVLINKSSYSDSADYLIINLKDGSTCWTSLISWK